MFIDWSGQAGEQVPGLAPGAFSGTGQDAAGWGDGGFVGELNKALAAGADINNPGASPGQGFPLRVESLDSTLYNVTYSAKDIKFWKALKKDRAYNTIEEYNQLRSYGAGNSIFMAEGDLPSEDDSTYARNYTRVKFMGIVRRVTHPMTLIRAAHGDAVARETVNGTLFLMQRLERALFEGDENLLDLQFDGLEKLLTGAWGGTVEDDGYISGYGSENCIDLRGKPLTQDHVTDLAEILVRVPNYGAPNCLWTPTGPAKDLSKLMYPNQRIAVPGNTEGTIGYVAKKIVTPFGDMDINPSIFLPDSDLPHPEAVGPIGQRPIAPTVTGITSPAYGGSNRNYWDSVAAGTYIYKIVAVNRYGKSAPVTTASHAVAAGDEVRIVVESTNDTSYFEVYRTAKGEAAAKARLIGRVKRTGPTVTIRDLNRFLPGCSKVYMLTQDPTVLMWKQLAPFTKIPLSIVDTSIRWMQVLYGALQVMAPLKNGMFINVGRLETGAYGA